MWLASYDARVSSLTAGGALVIGGNLPRCSKIHGREAAAQYLCSNLPKPVMTTLSPLVTFVTTVSSKACTISFTETFVASGQRWCTSSRSSDLLIARGATVKRLLQTERASVGFAKSGALSDGANVAVDRLTCWSCMLGLVTLTQSYTPTQPTAENTAMLL